MGACVLVFLSGDNYKFNTILTHRTDHRFPHDAVFFTNSILRYYLTHRTDHRFPHDDLDLPCGAGSIPDLWHLQQ